MPEDKPSLAQEVLSLLTQDVRKAITSPDTREVDKLGPVAQADLEDKYTDIRLKNAMLNGCWLF